MEEKEDKIRRQTAKTTRMLFLILSVLTLTALFLGAALFAYKQSTNKTSLQSVPSANSRNSRVTQEIIQNVKELDAAVRKKKATGVIMETESLALTGKLQEATRTLLAARYGPNEPYRVLLTLEFQKTIPDFKENGPKGHILLEMAPSRLVPHSIFTFLEIARQWQGGAFHRIAGHVLQVQVRDRTKKFKSLAFQEYDKNYPHSERTVGYAGRPSGPAWYVSIKDNSRNHGPGSQQSHNPYEADSCFGRIIDGYDTTVQRIKKVPGKGFVNDKNKHVLIKSMKILVPGSGPEAVDGYVEWKQSKEL